MNRNTSFILSILSFLSISSCAINEESYRALCMHDNLSYQKQLVCKKHQERLKYKLAREKSKATNSTIVKLTSSTESKEPILTKNPGGSFKEQRLSQRKRIKPYIPGAYKKIVEHEGESK